jgi:glutaredoxin-like protein
MMPLLRDEDRRQLEQIFAGRLVDPVTLVLFTQHESPLIVPAQECQTCRETRQLLEELVEITEKIKLEVKDFVRDGEEARRLGIDNIPAIILRGKNRGTLRIFGIPAGYEFAVLVEDIIDLSTGMTRLSDETRQQLSALTEPVQIKVMVTPT